MLLIFAKLFYKYRVKTFYKHRAKYYYFIINIVKLSIVVTIVKPTNQPTNQ